MCRRNRIDEPLGRRAPVLFVLLSSLGAGCSSIPLLERREEPYVISRVHTPTQKTDVLAEARGRRGATPTPIVVEEPTDETAAFERGVAKQQPLALEAAAATDETVARPEQKAEQREPAVALPTETDDAEETPADTVARDTSGSDATALQTASIARARTRPRMVRGDRIPGVPIVELASDFAGTVADVLLDPATGDIIGVVATSFNDSTTFGDVGTSARMFDFDALQWALGDIGTSLAVVGYDGQSAHDYETLFQMHESSSVRGVVTDIRRARDERSSAYVTLRDDNNRLHRILVGAVDLLTRLMRGVDEGETLDVEGILTRDGDGKLWIATAVTRDAQTIRLRGDSGEILWDELMAGFSSSRIPRVIRSADGAAVPVHGWIVDVDSGTTARLCVVVDGSLRLLAWDNVERDAGEWRTPYDLETLGTLRRYPVGPRAGDARPRH